jgi:pimeloyl-ACP methyl ester carboxylesterase
MQTPRGYITLTTRMGSKPRVACLNIGWYIRNPGIDFTIVTLLSRDPFRAIDDAPEVAIPVVAQHCTHDWIIPLSESRRLMQAFPKPPDFAIIEGRCHVPDVGRALLPKIRAAWALRRDDAAAR